MAAHKQRIRSNFTLGGYIAESDPLLLESYYDNGDYAAIESLTDPRRFIVGRTGSGKSAAFVYLEPVMNFASSRYTNEYEHQTQALPLRCQ